MGMLFSGSSASETPWQERDQSVQCINLHAESTLHNISVTLGISDGWKHYFSSFQGQNSQASLIRPKLRKGYGENRVGGLLTAKHCYCFLVLRKTRPFAITFFSCRGYILSLEGFYTADTLSRAHWWGSLPEEQYCNTAAMLCKRKSLVSYMLCKIHN